MKKTFLYLAAVASLVMTVLSCEKTAEPVKQESIVIEFTTDDEEEIQTKSSSASVLDLNNGCTVAFYAKSSGALKASGSCAAGTRRVVITTVPTESCNVYAIGNTSFSWPSAESSLKSQALAINVTSGYLPRATEYGKYSWNVGVTTMTLNLQKLYAKVSINKKSSTGTTFTAKSAKVINCPNQIYPFDAKATGTTGTNDYASSGDLSIFNSGNAFELYVPSDGTTKIEVVGQRNVGNGYNYTDTYTINVPAIGREKTESITITGTGVKNDENQIVVVIGDDTRRVNFGTSTLDVPGDNAEYKTTVRGYAGNGETNWTYKLSWTGVSALAGKATISVNGGAAQSLGTSGSISLPGNGSTNNIVIKSTYSGTTKQTVTFNALATDNSYSLANMTASLGKQPKWKTATWQEMMEFYISAVNNLGPLRIGFSTGHESEIMECPWNSLGNYCESSMNFVGTAALAQLFEDFDNTFESNVLEEFYINGYASYANVQPYVSYTGNEILTMYRWRLFGGLD